MKLLVLCSVLIVHLLGPTSGLQCYQCNDFVEGQSCKDPTNTTCGALHSDTYCGKADFVGAEEPFKYCKGNCSEKACMPSEMELMCEQSNPFEMSVDASGSGTVFCCQGDLCNGSGKLSNQIKALFFAVVFSCFYSLAGFLWN